jgi:phosphatidylglycerophosphatase A
MKRNIVPGSVWQKPSHFLAFGFGSGAAPVAPGTFGTLVAIPIYYYLVSYGQVVLLGVTVLGLLYGIFLCDRVSKDIGVHDHGGIVWDEIIGYMVTMLWVPFAWQWMLAGFLLFRLFDIWKPYPIRLLDKRVSGGLGIMIDDVLAGIYANLVIQAGIFSGITF